MPTLIQRVDPPALPYGMTADYYLTRTHQLPNGRKLVLAPRMARKPKDYVDAGLSFVAVGTQVIAESVLPKANAAHFFNQEYLQNSVGGSKPLKDMTRAEIKSACQNDYNQKPRALYSSGTAEPRYDRDPWCTVDYWNGSQIVQPQYNWIHECWKEIADENPGMAHYVGEYNGCVTIDPLSHSASAIRAALQSPLAAFNFCKSIEGVNRYFSDGHYQYNDCLVNQYFRANTNLHRRHHELLLTVAIANLALDHVRNVLGFDRKLCVFVFLQKTENVAYLGGYYSEAIRKNLPNNNGYTERWGFPVYTFGFHLELCQLAFTRCKYLWGWEDTNMFGRNENVVSRDQIRKTDGFPQIKTYNSSAPRANAVGFWDPNGTYGFPPEICGFEDAAPVSAETYQILNAHVNNGPFVWARSRANGGTAWTSLGNDHLYDRFLDKLPVVEVAKNSGNTNFAVRVIKFGEGMPQQFTIDVDLLGDGTKVVTLNCENGFPNNYLITYS